MIPKLIPAKSISQALRKSYLKRTDKLTSPEAKCQKVP